MLTKIFQLYLLKHWPRLFLDNFSTIIPNSKK